MRRFPDRRWWRYRLVSLKPQTAPSLKDEWARLEGTKKIERQGSISISNRYHLQDAAFLVALQGDDVALLKELDLWLRKPVYPIAGRRGYVLSQPLKAPQDQGGRRCDISDIFRNETLARASSPRISNLFTRQHDYER